MKNKEKYKDKILEIALQHDVVAVDENDNSVERCDEMPSCNYCLFQNDDECDDEKFKAWLEEEANENTPIKPATNDDKDEDRRPFDKLEYDNNACGCRWLYKLDDEEYGFLKIVESGYIARDMIDGDLMFYCKKPNWRDYLNEGYWFSPFNTIRLKNDSFDFIKAGECWAYVYNVNPDTTKKDIIYNITKDLRKDII